MDSGISHEPPTHAGSQRVAALAWRGLLLAAACLLGQAAIAGQSQPAATSELSGPATLPAGTSTASGSPPARTLQGLAGFYRMGPHETLHIALSGDRLTAQTNGPRRDDLGPTAVVLKPSSTQDFRVDGGHGTRLHFDIGDDGVGSAVTVSPSKPANPGSSVRPGTSADPGTGARRGVRIAN
jgi:hypothetical protein